MHIKLNRTALSWHAVNIFMISYFQAMCVAARGNMRDLKPTIIIPDIALRNQQLHEIDAHLMFLYVSDHV